MWPSFENCRVEEKQLHSISILEAQSCEYEERAALNDREVIGSHDALVT
jgi:hypothetical protein